MSEKVLEFKSERDFHKLYCEAPENLKAIEKSLDVILVARGNLLKMNGSEKSLNQCEELFKLLELGRVQGMIAKNQISGDSLTRYPRVGVRNSVIY